MSNSDALLLKMQILRQNVRLTVYKQSKHKKKYLHIYIKKDCNTYE